MSACNGMLRVCFYQTIAFAAVSALEAANGERASRSLPLSSNLSASKESVLLQRAVWRPSAVSAVVREPASMSAKATIGQHSEDLGGERGTDGEKLHLSDRPSFLLVGANSNYDVDPSEYRPWQIEDMVSPADPMNEPSWVKDLGRGLTIGSLYDVRTDQPVPGYLFAKGAIDGKTRRVDTPYTALEMVASDSLKDKFKLANIESSLALSVLVTSFEVEFGATAKYLKDKAESSKTSRVSINYMTRTHMEHLDLYDESLKHSVFEEPITNGLATHVVTGVLWGGNCYAIFEAESESVEEKLDVEASLRNLVKVSVGAFGFKHEIDGLTKTEDRLTSMAEKTTVRIYGDHVPDGRIPTEVNEALQYVQEIPAKIGQRPVPVAIQLFPLSKLDSKAARLRQQVSDYVINSAMELFMELDELEVMVKDLTIIKEDGFVLWKENVQSYLADLQKYRMSVVQRLALILRRIRDGEEPQDRLLEPIREHQASDFSKNMVTRRVRIFTDQIYNLKAWVRALVNSGVNIAYSFSDFTSKTFDGDYDDVYVLIFRGMNPSADRLSSALMRRFSSFASKRRGSKTSAFIFVHYDSFVQQFGIEAALSAMDRQAREQITQLLQSGGPLVKDASISSNSDDFKDGELYRSESMQGHQSDRQGALLLEPSHSSFPNPDILPQAASQPWAREPAALSPHDFAKAERLHTLQDQQERFSHAEKATGNKWVVKKAMDSDHLAAIHSTSRKLRASPSDSHDALLPVNLSAPIVRGDMVVSEQNGAVINASQEMPACASRVLQIQDVGCQVLLPPQCQVLRLVQNHCVWLEPTKSDTLLQCTDGSFCNISETLGWSCCDSHGFRQRCPLGYNMCNWRDSIGEDFGCWESCYNHGGARTCPGFDQQTAQERFTSLPCQEVLSNLPAVCLTVGVSSDACRFALPKICSGDTMVSFEVALASNLCIDRLRDGLEISLKTCEGIGCKCDLSASLPEGSCCDRRLGLSRIGRNAGGSWCVESPCQDGQLWCESFETYQISANASTRQFLTSEDQHVLQGRCVGDCSLCGGSRMQAVNSICEIASPEICYFQAGGLMYCPPSRQCMSECSACAGFESKDMTLHTCVKTPSPASCFEARGGLFFCPSSVSCVNASSCQALCEGHPKVDFERWQCSTGAVLVSPLTIVGRTTRDVVSVEFEASVPASLFGASRQEAYATIIILQRSYSQHPTAVELWHLAREQAVASRGLACILFSQAVPLSPRKVSWTLRDCRLDVETLYNIFLVLSHDAADPTEALLSVVSLFVAEQITFSSQASAIMDSSRSRVSMRFSIEDKSSQNSHQLLGWSWLLPSRLAACCLNESTAALEPLALLSILRSNGIEGAEAAVVEGLLGCGIRAAPVQPGRQEVWNLECPDALQHAFVLKVSVAARVFVSINGAGGTLTPLMPVVVQSSCTPADVSVINGRFGCSHSFSIDEGSVCEVVPDALPGWCTHTRLHCQAGQWMSCAAAPPAAALLETNMEAIPIPNNSLVPVTAPSLALAEFRARLSDPTLARDCALTSTVTCFVETPKAPLRAQSASPVSYASSNAAAPAEMSQDLAKHLQAVADMWGGSVGSVGVGTPATPSDAANIAQTFEWLKQLVPVLGSIGKMLVPSSERGEKNLGQSSANGTSAFAWANTPDQVAVQDRTSGPRLPLAPSFFQLAHGEQHSLQMSSKSSSFHQPVSIVNVLSGRRAFAGKTAEHNTWTQDQLGATVSLRGPEQLWWLVQQLDGSFKIVNALSSRKLFAKAWPYNMYDGFFGSTNDFDGHTDQDWWINIVEYDVFRIVCRDSGRALFAEADKDGAEGFGAIGGPDGVERLDTRWRFEPRCSVALRIDASLSTESSAIFTEGSYNLHDLNALGFEGDTILGAVVFAEHCVVTMYEQEGFVGASIILLEGDHAADTFGNYSYRIGSMRVEWLDPLGEQTFQTTIGMANASAFLAPNTAHASAGYIGCYKDDSARDMPFARLTATNTQSCRVACAGYEYMGLQSGGLCFCGDTYARETQYAQVLNTECGTRCAGEELMCGGKWRNAIYRVSLGDVARNVSETSPDFVLPLTFTTTSTPMVNNGFSMPHPSQSAVEYGLWSECSQPCGAVGLRSRPLLCYKNNAVAPIEDCGVRGASLCDGISLSSYSGVDALYCELEPCNRMECVDLHPDFNESDSSRKRYNHTRCTSSAGYGRKALQISGADNHMINFRKCAEACRWTPGCTFFTVLHAGHALESVAEVPWCYSEAARFCELPGGRGFVKDDAWDLYRLSAEADSERTTLPHTRGAVTHTVIWHYQRSVLIDENFIPPFLPDAPSAPVAVGRGAIAGSDVEQWLQLSWDPPAETGGADILYYQIRTNWWQSSYVTSSGAAGERQLTYKQLSKITESRGPTTTNVLVVGLQAGRRYTFEVAASNSEGTSAWSPGSAVVQMGAATAHAEPSATTWAGGDVVTLTLTVAAESPVDHVIVVVDGGQQQANCALVSTPDPYSQFACLTPAWVRLGDLPTALGSVREAKMVAYDVAGSEIAAATLRYADFSCPAHAQLNDVSIDDSNDADCAWFRNQSRTTCAMCECSMGYTRAAGWTRSESGNPSPTGRMDDFSQPNQSCCAACAWRGFCSPLSQSCYNAKLRAYYVSCTTPDAGSSSPGFGADTVALAPPLYSPQSRCEAVQSYCRSFDFPNGRLPDASSEGLRVGDVVADLVEVCDAGYELGTTDGGIVVEEVSCLPVSRQRGMYGIAGRPREFMCTEVPKFCTKQSVSGGEIPFASIFEKVVITCNSPSRDTWPYHIQGSSARVQCVRNGNSHDSGKFVTEAGESVDGKVECAGCTRTSIDSDGELGWISAAPIGQHGKMHCPAGWVLSDDFRDVLGPVCTAESGERIDGLLGKWSFDAFNGKPPRCVFEDRCKDVACGLHGECVVTTEQLNGGSGTLPTWSQRVAKCMCSGGYHGTHCEQAPAMKCDYQVRFEIGNRQAQLLPVTQSLRAQLIEAAGDVVGAYKQLLQGDAEKEEQVVRALMTRTTSLQNMKVCCVKLDSSVRGKNGYERVETREFTTSISNVQITTTGTGIEDAMRHLMTEASLALASKARENVRESGLSENQVSVLVSSITADIQMPKGLPPEGACMAV